MRGSFQDTLRMSAIALILLTLFGIVGLSLQIGNKVDAITPITAAPVDAAGQSLLVDVAWLADRLDSDDPPVVIDVSPARQYAQEHIPGAIHLWWQDTMNLNGAGYGEALNLSAPSRYRPEIGATQDQTIVVYDNMASKYASRVVWQLRTSGYPDARVLDGGLAAWMGAGFETSADPDAPRDVPAPDETWLAENVVKTGELADSYDSPGIVLLDTRNDEQARDTVNETIREGRIPGSISLPAESVMRDDGTFRSPGELAGTFADAGLSPDQTIVVYGRFGVETGQVWLALRLAGYDNVRVYDDGWVAWGHDASLPIEPVGE